MRPWNLLPLADRATRLRRWTVVGGWGLCALGGGALAGVWLSAQDAHHAQLQADMVNTQKQFDRDQQHIAQQRQQQLQAQQRLERWQYVQAMQQRVQRLDAWHKVMAQRWPTGVQVQEWRVEGAGWRLQGRADSADAVHQLLQELTPLGPWQQAPTLLELSALPTLAGTNDPGLRYVVQARWLEPSLPTQAGAGVTASTPSAWPPPQNTPAVNR